MQKGKMCKIQKCIQNSFHKVFLAPRWKTRHKFRCLHCTTDHKKTCIRGRCCWIKSVSYVTDIGNNACVPFLPYPLFPRSSANARSLPGHTLLVVINFYGGGYASSSMNQAFTNKRPASKTCCRCTLYARPLSEIK